MHVVVGLGNPGADYTQTRHNVGFRIVDALAAAGGGPWVEKWQSLVMEMDDLLLLKPQTYMNCSGDAIGEMLDTLTVTPQQILIVTDDVNLQLGQLRARAGGSAGGHNGLASVETALATQGYGRLRVGVGQEIPPTGADLIDFVLGPFTSAEESILKKVVPVGVKAVGCWVEFGMTACQNEFNGWQLAEDELDKE